MGKKKKVDEEVHPVEPVEPVSLTSEMIPEEPCEPVHEGKVPSGMEKHPKFSKFKNEKKGE